MNVNIDLLAMEIQDLLDKQGSMTSPEIAKHLGLLMPASCRSGYDTQPQILVHALMVFLEANGRVRGNYSKPVMWWRDSK